MTSETENDHDHCMSQRLRMCPDGSCVSDLDLCMEEEKVNQNTILIMIIIGVVVIIAMIILYCFQQRSRRQAQNNSGLETIVQDGDNASLDNPPPPYDEVMGSNLYLPTTTSCQANGASSLSRLPSAEEPMTPPPNYDAALTILGQSHESFFPRKTEERSSVIRRSVSTDTTLTAASPTARSPPADVPNPFEYRRNVSINETS